MENNNLFNLNEILDKYANSTIPAERLFYFNALKQLLKIGTQLHDLQKDEEKRKELANDLQKIENMIQEYKIYPLIEK